MCKIIYRTSWSDPRSPAFEVDADLRVAENRESTWKPISFLSQNKPPTDNVIQQLKVSIHTPEFHQQKSWCASPLVWLSWHSIQNEHQPWCHRSRPWKGSSWWTLYADWCQSSRKSLVLLQKLKNKEVITTEYLQSFQPQKHCFPCNLWKQLLWKFCKNG